MAAALGAHTVETLQALEAAGAGVAASLAALRRSLEQRERNVSDASGAEGALLRQMAEDEADAGELMQRRHAWLATEERRQLSLRAALDERRAEAASQAASIEEDIWEVSSWSTSQERILLEASGERFETTGSTLRRSPWFARLLDELKSTSRSADACAQAAATDARARKRLRKDAPIFLCLERDDRYFRVILSYLRLGADDAAAAAILGESTAGNEEIQEEDREALLSEAIFFELYDLAGKLLRPPVGAEVQVRLLSKAELEAAGVEALLPHEVCGTWHAPGRCLHLGCRRGGTALVRGIVVAATFAGESSKAPRWTVECHGQTFADLPRDRLLPTVAPACPAGDVLPSAPPAAAFVVAGA
eukprot:TRINITY_DN74553_c0_g1_i1.p1 TRINITY_DN74553_c0_g1~~TRINITY_DN74553_c0_g1_i1.p1  ORF type:complete len:362 (-),score=92.48 TRINITY_DN74553_c0_g1_i1:34-1119(-)